MVLVTRLKGPYLHSLNVSKLAECRETIHADTSTYGISCVKTLLNVQQVNVTYESEALRLKKAAVQAFDSGLLDNSEAMTTRTSRSNADILIFKNATVVSMIHGMESLDILRHRRLLIRDGVIMESSAESDIDGNKIPLGAKVIDIQGGLIFPGFIDVHAHWNGPETVSGSWEQRTFIAYGCTTVHK